MCADDISYLELHEQLSNAYSMFVFVKALSSLLVIAILTTSLITLAIFAFLLCATRHKDMKKEESSNDLSLCLVIITFALFHVIL